MNLLMFGVATFLGFLAPNIYILAALRFIATLGLGAELVTGFAMVAEFAPIRHRGRWAGAVSFIGNIGSPLGLLLCTLIIPSYGWRPLFFIVGAAALILWMVRRLNIPESPRWLISQGREEEAKEIIEKMEINGSYEPINHDHDHAKHTINISLKRGLIVGIIAAAATTLCQYTFTTWVPTILVKQGGDIFHSLMFSTVMTIGAPLGALAGSFLIDMFGRRKTITTGFILIAILGVAYAYQTNNTMVMIIGFLLTMCMYAMSASILSVYVPELFPTRYRFQGKGYAAGSGKLLNVLMPYFII